MARIQIEQSSLGAYAIACALEQQLIRPKKVVWQTLSLNGNWSIMKSCKIGGFGIIGTADSRYQTAFPYLPESPIIIQGADHGMAFDDELLRSIEALERVIQATDQWIGR